MNQKNPFLHCIFQTANLYSCNFSVPGRENAERSSAGQLAAGSRPRVGHCWKDFYLAVIYFQMQREKGTMICLFLICIVCGKQEKNLHLPTNRYLEESPQWYGEYS